MLCDTGEMKAESQIEVVALPKDVAGCVWEGKSWTEWGIALEVGVDLMLKQCGFRFSCKSSWYLSCYNHPYILQKLQKQLRL